MHACKYCRVSLKRKKTLLTLRWPYVFTVFANVSNQFAANITRPERNAANIIIVFEIGIGNISGGHENIEGAGPL